MSDSDSYSFLRKVPLFAELPDADLEQLCRHVDEVSLQPGAILFTEGSIGRQAYVIKEGEIEIFKTANGGSVQLAVRRSGEVIGEMSLLESAPRSASGKALTASLLLAISQEEFDHLLNSNPSMTRTMLHTVTARLRSTELMLNQSEKMAQLGTLTAGIAHELNNPSAAVRRGAEQFKTALQQAQDLSAQIYTLGLSQRQLHDLADLNAEVRQAALHPRELDALARSDAEGELEDWLDDHGVENGWDLAPQLVSLGVAPDRLDELAGGWPQGSLPVLLAWMASSFNLINLLEEIGQGSTRISEIIKALKSYVYLDQAPTQEIDIHEGLDNTLVILRHKLKTGVEVRREYGAGIPRIQAYASELNQVWTNLIDNAIDAMDGKGKITVRTSYEAPWVIVDIADTGPGVPPDVQAKIFSPFFTTKPLGKGTGLGLSISYNIIHKHKGDIKIISQPGETHFQVWLPVDFQANGKSGQTIGSIRRSSDEELRQILESAHDVAVVGMSDHTDTPAYSVPAYLQKHGYHVIPVNPEIGAVLGEKPYPDLKAVDGPVDIVLVFRRSEFVPEIVDQAIAIGAKVVWMQEGIVNEGAAQKARQAGLQVVMDTCIRLTHKRVIGEKV